jgi:hypothetical protein
MSTLTRTLIYPSQIKAGDGSVGAANSGSHEAVAAPITRNSGAIFQNLPVHMTI